MRKVSPEEVKEYRRKASKEQRLQKAIQEGRVFLPALTPAWLVLKWLPWRQEALVIDHTNMLPEFLGGVTADRLMVVSQKKAWSIVGLRHWCDLSPLWR